MLSKAKHLLADYTLFTVIPREHSDRGNPLAGYTLSTRVVAGRLRGDSSLRSEWQHRTSLLITNCSLLIIWDCHGLFQASQWRDLYNTCHTLSHYPHPLWHCDFVTMWQPRQRNIREHHDPISCQSGANLPPIKMLRWMGHTRGISHSVQRLRWWRSATITRNNSARSHANMRLYGNR